MLLKDKYQYLNQADQQDFKKRLLAHKIKPKQFFDNHSRKPIAMLPLGVFLTYAELLQITKEEILREEPRLAILITSTRKKHKNTFTQQNPNF